MRQKLVILKPTHGHAWAFDRGAMGKTVAYFPQRRFCKTNPIKANENRRKTALAKRYRRNAVI